MIGDIPAAAQAGRDDFLETWKPAARRGRAGEIERSLASADPRLGALVERVVKKRGRIRFGPPAAWSHFDAVARSIIYQQLGKQAAATIYARYSATLGGQPGPEQVMAAPPVQASPPGPPLWSGAFANRLPDGMLIKAANADTVYVMHGGAKRPVASAEGFNRHGYKWDQIWVVPVHEINSLPTGPAVN